MINREQQSPLSAAEPEADIAAPPAHPLIAVDDLHVTFATAGGRVQAVSGLSFHLDAGRTLGIIGESGSGKSVTARAIMRILPERTARIERGSIRFDGQELVGLPEPMMRRRRGQDIAMVFQDPMRSLDPTMRVGTQLVEAIRIHEKRLSRKAARSRALELLEAVHLAEPQRQIDAYPVQLSGGMAQRVMIAVALAGRPRLLIADESTSSLDVTTQAQILDLLYELRQRFGMAVIFITHDLGVAATCTDEIAVMYAGRIVEHATTARLFTSMAMPYTKALLDSLPSLDAAPGELAAIPGVPADASAPPPGCPFHPRCPRAEQRCRTERPPLTEEQPGHRFACWFPLTPRPAHLGAAHDP